MRSLREGPPLRSDLPPDKAECAQWCDRVGYPFPAAWCDFSGYDRRAWHRYEVAMAEWEGWPRRPPEVLAAALAVLRDPADLAKAHDLSRAIDATSRKQDRRTANGVSAGQKPSDDLLSTYTHGYGGSATRRGFRLVATRDREAVSLLENIARTVQAAEGRRDLSAAEWADRCGVSVARLSKLLTDYAEPCGLAVRRYRTGTNRTSMIEISAHE